LLARFVPEPTLRRFCAEPPTKKGERQKRGFGNASFAPDGAFFIQVEHPKGDAVDECNDAAC
jgi:hypothetical protein